MAIAGGASPAFEWVVQDNTLYEATCFVLFEAASDVRAIVDMLSRGRTVFVSARHDVRDAARAALRQQGVRA